MDLVERALLVKECREELKEERMYRSNIRNRRYRNQMPRRGESIDSYFGRRSRRRENMTDSGLYDSLDMWDNARSRLPARQRRNTISGEEYDAGDDDYVGYRSRFPKSRRSRRKKF
ncbi:MAG: hypothetical protein GC206_13390 [Alphaproteobacteria bacterium]|nr:hypothetical protein [Alphaproteobacteria bacterium]